MASARAGPGRDAGGRRRMSREHCRLDCTGFCTDLVSSVRFSGLFLGWFVSFYDSPRPNRPSSKRLGIDPQRSRSPPFKSFGKVDLFSHRLQELLEGS